MAKYPALALFALLFLSCNQDASHVLPRYTGAPGEVICVMDDRHYEGTAGDIIYKYLGATQPLLPQSEPIFNLVQMNPTQVNQITRQHRNLLFVNLSSASDEKPRVEAKRNRWASEQMVVTVYASSISQLDSLMTENGPSIVDKFNEYERRRLQSYYRSRSNKQISDNLKDRDLDIVAPSDCSIAQSEADFLWIKRRRTKNVSGTAHDILQGIFVYYYPYVSDSAFSAKEILQVRDSVLKKFVPGPLEGSYMTTEYLLPPQSKAIHFKGNYAVETRGLWRTEGAVMGGPFIGLTMLDEKNQRVVTAEGFVFAPKFDKREYLREVEAIIYSLEINPADTSATE